MKKYVKPVLIYESFAMAQQIAACEYDHNNTYDNVESCGFTKDEGITIFMLGGGNAHCNTLGEAYCYQNAEIGFSLLNS